MLSNLYASEDDTARLRVGVWLNFNGMLLCVTLIGQIVDVT